MPILIDGHNLIPHTGISLADPDDEEQLVKLLRRYALHGRKKTIVVVFDQGVDGHPRNLNGYNVTCHFAIPPDDADRELMRRIRQIKRIGEWEVVTSDRAVAGVARAQRVRVVPSDVFARRLLERPQPTVQASEKYQERALSQREIAEWLAMFGVDEDEQADDL